MREFKEENVRQVTVPLEVEEIKEFFTNKELLYYVNYKKSKLNGSVFLTYLSNLDLPAEINFEGLEFNEKEEIFKNYMATRNIIGADSLRLNLAMILCVAKGVNVEGVFIDPVLTTKEVEKFISNNNELVNKWLRFLDSTTVFAKTTVSHFEEDEAISSELEVIDDIHYIGANVVNLFSIPSFMELYLEPPSSQKLAYFKQQFDEYMFKGKNLFSYFLCPENTPYLAFVAHLSGAVGLENITHLGAISRHIDSVEAR